MVKFDSLSLYLFPPFAASALRGKHGFACVSVRFYVCVRCVKANSRPAACKLCVTCEAAATLYGEHSISVQLDLAKHSGSREERVCERVTLSGGVCVRVRC